MTTENSPEDYLHIELVNWNGSESNPRDSYLRLGAEDDPAVYTYGDSLSSQIDSFVDDTRIRGGNDGDPVDDATSKNVFNTLSQAERAAETARLRTKGGWRDHTDGNRITTTRGDKVEVIRGNYKLLVLGREQWKNDAGVGLNYESSGGITYHYDEVPGQIVDVRWEYEDAIETWRVVEECDKGHVVERYHGRAKEWIQGGDVVTRIGSLYAYDGTNDISDPDNFKTDAHFDKPSGSSHNNDFLWPSDDVLPNVREEVAADKFTDKLYCVKLESHEGSPDRYIDKIESRSFANGGSDSRTYTNYEAEHHAATASREIWAGFIYTEFFLGWFSTKKGDFFVDIRTGVSIVEANFLTIVEANSAAITVDIQFSLAKTEFIHGDPIIEVEASLFEVQTKSPATIEYVPKSKMLTGFLSMFG